MPDSPEWMRGIRKRFDYGWRYDNVRGVLPDRTIMLDNGYAELEREVQERGLARLAPLSCFQCGSCAALCPAGTGTTEKTGWSVRQTLHKMQLGLEHSEYDDIWLCTTCLRCSVDCPRGVDIADLLANLRKVRTALGVGAMPASIERAMKNIAGTGNPFGESRERTEWAAGLDVPRFRRGMELLYFPCCFNAYDSMAKGVAKATVRILSHSGVDFGILDSQERCCGESVRKAGDESLFRSLAQHNIGVFAENGVRKILTNSPHCYKTFKSEYPGLGGEFEVIHSTQYFAQLIKDGRLKLTRRLNKRVTYHDPCYLGRHSGVYHEPRELLRAIPGLELVEMPDCGQRSLCCGGGGGRIWLDTQKGERLSDLRLEQAARTGAGVLATSCPYCLINFEDSRLTGPGEETIVTKDIAELLWEAL